MKLLRNLLCLALFLLCTSLAFASNLSARSDVQQYVERVSQQYSFDVKQLNSWFDSMDLFQPTVSTVKKPPVPFYVYRDRIMTPERIEAGVQYWQAHKQTFDLAEQRYGVPASIIMGILGIETTYGANTGHYSAFQGLASMAFNRATRKEYFASELTEYLLLCREHGWNPLAVRSSFDGGLGLAQFMPSSYRKYAVSANPALKPDLFDEDDDAILSVANYLMKKGWHPGEPVVIPGKVVYMQGKSVLMPTSKVPHYLNMKTLPLMEKNGFLYWVSFHNFYVIKSYNNSNDYAMTVYQLGQAVVQD